jgi:hypothetical protein
MKLIKLNSKIVNLIEFSNENILKYAKNKQYCHDIS